MRTNRKTLQATTDRALERFVELVGDGQHRPQQKFIRDALVGLQVEGNVTLSSWARALDEPTDIKHSHKRLSRNLGSKRFVDGVVRARALELAAPLVGRHTDVIAVDGMDVSKTYGRKMPLQGKVHDGSKGDEGIGWDCLRIDGISRHGKHLPLYARLYSHEATEYRGNHAELEAGFRAVVPCVPKRSVWVFDREYDGASYRKLFGKYGIDFVVRLDLSHTDGQRRVVVDGVESRLRQLVRTMKMRAVFRTQRVGIGRRKSRRVRAGWVNGLRFQPSDGPLEKQSYTVVVVRNLDGSQPIVLLTNRRVESNVEARKVAQQYLYRWGIEVGHRLLKRGGFDLENLRARTWRGVQRIALLTFLAFLFLAWMLLLTAPKAMERLLRAAPVTGRRPAFLHGRLRAAVGWLLDHLPRARTPRWRQ